MKVSITDMRINTRIVNIEGKQFVFPSKKEVVRDISVRAYNLIKQFPFLKVVPVEIPYTEAGIEQHSDITKLYGENAVADTISETSFKGEVEEVKDDNIGVEDHKEEDNKIEEPRNMRLEEVKPLANDTEAQEVMEGSSIVDPNVEYSKPVDYQSMSKRDLRALMESKGGDPQGMSKANMVAWLEKN